MVTGPVLKQVASDLVLQRSPDLGGFSEEEVAAELAPLFSKSGLYPEAVTMLQDLVRSSSYGLVTMETARPQDLSDFDPAKPFFADVQRIKGLFHDRLVVITSAPPHFELVEQAVQEADSG